MATQYTSLLGFALPTTGELSGTWGDVVNQNITELVEDAIAATATASVTSGDWTLSTTGSGSANEARCAILIPTGTPGVSRNVVAPSQSKAYVVINQSDAAVVVKGSATTGVTISAGAKAVVAWDGSDFVTVASSEVDGVSTISFGTTGLTPNTDTSGAVTVAGTLAVANGGTGQTSYTDGQLLIGNSTGNTLDKATLTAGTGISVTNGSGSVTVTNSAPDQTVSLTQGGATTITGTYPSFTISSTNTTYSAGTGITLAGTTFSIPQAITTTSSVQFGSFGVGTAASGTTGEIRATNNVTAYYSSDRKFKENVKDIEHALDKVCAIGVKTFDWTDAYIIEHGGEDGYFIQKSSFGVIAQDVQAVFPEAVRVREDGSLALDYEKLAVLSFGAIKELVKRIEELEAK